MTGLAVAITGVVIVATSSSGATSRNGLALALLDEAIVIPEATHAIRAMSGLGAEGARSDGEADVREIATDDELAP